MSSVLIGHCFPPFFLYGSNVSYWSKMKNHGALGTRMLLKKWMDSEAVHTWIREGVSSCNCSEKTYRHVHCRCSRCKEMATTRSIELRHWSEARLLDAGATGTVEFNFHSGGGSDTNGAEEGMDTDEERTCRRYWKWMKILMLRVI